MPSISGGGSPWTPLSGGWGILRRTGPRASRIRPLLQHLPCQLDLRLKRFDTAGFRLVRHAAGHSAKRARSRRKQLRHRLPLRSVAESRPEPAKSAPAPQVKPPRTARTPDSSPRGAYPRSAVLARLSSGQSCPKNLTAPEVTNGGPPSEPCPQLVQPPDSADHARREAPRQRSARHVARDLEESHLPLVRSANRVLRGGRVVVERRDVRVRDVVNPGERPAADPLRRFRAVGRGGDRSGAAKRDCPLSRGPARTPRPAPSSRSDSARSAASADELQCARPWSAGSRWRREALSRPAGGSARNDEV